MSTLFSLGGLPANGKTPFLQDHSFSFTLTFLLRPVRLWRHYKEHKFPDGTDRKVIEARTLPTPPPHKVATIGGANTKYKNYLSRHSCTMWKYTSLYMTAAVCRYQNYSKISSPETYGLYFINIKWSSDVIYKPNTRNMF